ncbi:hypothetical protein [Pelosinus fermentans]|jgi:hypothetical protein|uniref:Uncharacterized protein n=1 Tax=Pelosinus fermentans JBW45 TaxID=1192197 RepID=I9NUU7_9FIRM|nr:hypothetical protein [Pelosinus fermentans]AJQ29934.1 hypothetical protein JBW_04605 [Pelosinus fermentans JBW45]
MDGMICSNCHTWMTTQAKNCPDCNADIVMDGESKNVIDRIQPNCLIYRYDGSDLLEAGVVIKQLKVNMKVATKLREYSAPLLVPKHKVYAFNQNLLSSIQGLRNERTATMVRFDQLIKSHWQNLEPYQHTE